MAAGETDAAKGYAERAYRLRPNAAWAFQSVFDLGLDRGAWRETVTDYMPEPWLIALERDRTGLPVRPGHRPGANR